MCWTYRPVKDMPHPVYVNTDEVVEDQGLDSLLEGFHYNDVIKTLRELPNQTELLITYINLGYSENIERLDDKCVRVLFNELMYMLIDIMCELHKQNEDRCFGLVTDKKQLVVFEYGEGGKDAELVICKRI